MRHRGRWILAGALVAIVAVGAFGYWWKFVRDDEHPVDVRAVEAGFGGDRRGRAGQPRPGVYLYDTTGSESIDALGGQRHTYPTTTTLTVTDTKCGVNARWDVLSGRYDVNRRCRAATDAWTLRSTVVASEFFNTTQVDRSRCDVVELPADPKAGDTTQGRCDHGPDFVSMRVQVLGSERLRIGGTKVETVHLRIRSTQGGQRSGGGVEHRWVQAGTNLVVRSRVDERDVSPSPVGRVTYEQRYEIELRSLRPRT